jgi:hypothetical protein
VSGSVENSFPDLEMRSSYCSQKVEKKSKIIGVFPYIDNNPIMIFSKANYSPKNLSPNWRLGL